MQYVSTRGTAPVLGFTDALLAGLATDGGLYVPEVWPQMSPETIRGLFGRPYWEVAVEVIRPFVAGEISDADLGRMASDAYATFRHPAVVPLRQSGPSQFVLELFHGPTLAFKDLAMQLVARLMDHVLQVRGERTTIVVATSGDTGGAAVEAFRGRSQVDVVVLFPHGRISDVQRLMMTTAPDAMIEASSRTTVTNGTAAFRSAWRTTTRHASAPRARAARTKGRASTSRMLPRRYRDQAAACTTASAS